MAGRRWFFCALLGGFAIDFIDGWVKGEGWAPRSNYLIFVAFSIIAFLLGAWSNSRRVQIGGAVSMVVYQRKKGTEELSV